MHDETASLVHARRETRAEDEDVNPALDVREHQARDGRQALRLLLRLVLLLLLPALRKLFQVRLVVEHETARSGVRNGGGEVPALEDSLLDVVAVVGARASFGHPALLEECSRGLVEGNFYALRAVGVCPLPEIV